MKLRLGMALATILLAGCGPKDSGSETSGFDSSEFDAQRWKPGTNDAYINENETDLASGKKSALVYYAVDTEEPFMQAAVDYEVKALRATCVAGNEQINWIVLLNSYYVHGGRRYLVCKDGKYAQKYLKPDYDKIIRIVSATSFDPSKPESKGLTIELNHPTKFNKLFKKYPFAHPEVLKQILTKVVREEFPTDKFAYVLQLKSHGSDELLLSGLTEEQLEKKVTRQKDALTKHLRKVGKAALDSKRELDYRNRVSCESKGAKWTGTACYCKKSKLYINQFFGECERSIGEAGLGKSRFNELGFDVIGLGKTQFGASVLGEPGMGEPGMGEPGMGEPGMGEPGMGEPGMGEPGMGEAGMGYKDIGADGLGVAGMGANVHFGTPHAAMAKVIEAVAAADMRLSFVIFESCESSVDKNETLKKALRQGDVDGYYSAGGSLWYRNFDWYEILPRVSNADDQNKQAIKILGSWVKKVPTYVAVEDH